MNPSEKETNPYIPIWVLVGVALFCFIAATDLPYGYYLFLRWIACGTAIVAAIQSYLRNRIGMIWLMGIVALIFNPIAPFHFDKDTWRILDIGAGICFLIVGLIGRDKSIAT